MAQGSANFKISFTSQIKLSWPNSFTFVVSSLAISKANFKESILLFCPKTRNGKATIIKNNLRMGQGLN
jgi:hypothetical protein